MRKIVLVLSLALVGIFNYACAGNPEKKNGSASSEQAAPDKGEVIQMDNALFMKKVFDYTKGAEWKYEGDKPAIIDFYADWCGPCRKIAPLMKEFAKEYEGKIVIYKVDTDKEKELSGAMGIQSLPTVVFIPLKGEPRTIVGAADKATFKRAIDEYLLGMKPQAK